MLEFFEIESNFDDIWATLEVTQILIAVGVIKGAELLNKFVFARYKDKSKIAKVLNKALNVIGIYIRVKFKKDDK